MLEVRDLSISFRTGAGRVAAPVAAAFRAR